MSRRTLARVGATFSVLGGLVLLYVAARRGHRLDRWRLNLPAIGLAKILSSATPLAWAAVGTRGSSTLSAAFEFVIGTLWMALGVTVWREASPSENGTIGAARSSRGSRQPGVR